MAVKKLSELTALTTAADGDLFLVNDVSEPADVDKPKKITAANLKSYIMADDSIYAAGYMADGRLTLESGVPISSSSQNNKTTLYYTPYIGNSLVLYDGTGWGQHAFSELSLDMAAYTASKPYDIFVFDDSGTITLEGLVWTNATTRATALVRQNGVFCKTGALTRRYIGTVYIDADGKCDDSRETRYVWNMYNRAPRRMLVTNGSAHNYNGDWRKWNNSDTNNLLKFVTGQPEDKSFSISLQIESGAAGSVAMIRVYTDGDYEVGHYANEILTYNPEFIRVGTTWTGELAAGYHYAQVYEYSNHNSSYFYTFSIDTIGYF